MCSIPLQWIGSVFYLKKGFKSTIKVVNLNCDLYSKSLFTKNLPMQLAGKCCIYYCKSIWIKASAKCMIANLNFFFFLSKMNQFDSLFSFRIFMVLFNHIESCSPHSLEFPEKEWSVHYHLCFTTNKFLYILYIHLHNSFSLSLSGSTVLFRPGCFFPLCGCITHVPAGILHLPLACLWLQIPLSGPWTQSHTRLQCPSPRQSGNRRLGAKSGGRSTWRRKTIPWT